MGTTVAGGAGVAGMAGSRCSGLVARGVRRFISRSGRLCVSRLADDWDIKRSGSVGEGLASGEVLSSLGEDSVRSAQVRKLVLRGGRLGLVALDADVEVGKGLRVELAVDTDNLVVQVLLEVSLDVLGSERLKFTGSLLSLQTGGQGDRAFGHDGLRRVGTTDHHTTDNTIGTNIVGGLSVVGGWVVSSLAIIAIIATDRDADGDTSSAKRDASREGRVSLDRVGSSRVGSGVAARLANEAVNNIGSLKRVLVGSDGKDGVVLAFLDGTAKVLASLGDMAITLAHGSAVCSVERVDGTDNLVVRVGASVGVEVSKSAGLVDVLRGVVVAGGVLGEGLQGSVRVLGLALVPLGHGAHHVTVGDVGVGADDLEHGEKTIDVAVVEPEERVESSDIEVGHVTTALTARNAVDKVVDRLDAVDAATAEGSTDTNSSSAGSAPVGLAGEESKDTVTNRNAGRAKTSVQLVVVAASRIGDRAAKRDGPAVPWASAHLRGKRVAPAVAIERVGDPNRTLGLVDSDGLVPDEGWDSRSVAWITGVVKVRHTQSRGDLSQTTLLASRELLNHLKDRLVPSLLWTKC